MPTNERVTGAEIGRRMGRSRQRVAQLTKEEGFPAAVDRVGPANLYDWKRVAAWLTRRGYVGRW